MKKMLGLLFALVILCAGSTAMAEREFLLGVPYDGLASVTEKLNWSTYVLHGYLNTEGEMFTGDWESGMACIGGYAAVRSNGKYGFINTAGELVIPYEWDNVRFFREGLVAVQKDGKWGFLNGAGELVIPCQWDYCSYGFIDGLAHVSNEDGSGRHYFIDQTGEVVLTVTGENVGEAFYDGLAYISRDGKYGYFNREGEMVIPCQWETASNFHNGTAVVTRGGLEYCIDVNGRILFCYESLIGCENSGNFSEGLMRVRFGGLQGFMNQQGEMVIPCEWTTADDFREGVARVKNGDGWGVIDRTGTLIIPCEYDNIVYGNGYYFLVKDAVITIVDSDMNVTGVCDLRN